ncbi:MAG: FtsX-like permease family protein, partial [Bryobacteraceae bacterium]
RALVVGELALALTLLSGAGLALHSFSNLTRVDLGVRTDHVLIFSLQQPDGRFRVATGIVPYYKQVLEQIHALPGVSAAAVATGAPLLGTSDGMPFTIVGTTVADPSQRPGAGFQSISPEYFRTFGVRLVKGRQFSEADTSTSPRVAVVNEEFVKEYLKGRDPLNTRLSIEQIDPTVQKLGAAVEWQIVGVFHNVRSFGLRADQPEIDVPFPQSPLPSVTIGLRSGGNPAELSAAVAKAIYSIDRDVAVSHLSTMNEVRDQLFIGDRFTMMLYVGFAFVALTLAAIGVYGVISFGVSRRTQEIGLRMALGAEKRAVERLIISESFVLTLVGLALGVLGAAWLGRLMHSTLYGVQAFDSPVLLGVSVLLFGTALLAAYIPARRAAAVDPMRALRTE